MNKLKLTLISMGAVAALVGIGGYAYLQYNNPQAEFAKNEIKQLDKLNKYIDVRAKISKDYGKKAEDKSQRLEFKHDLFSLDLYKDGLEKHSAVRGKGNFLGKTVDILAVEKDDKLNVDMNFYKKVLEVPNKVLTKQAKQLSGDAKAQGEDISLNDFVESFFFLSKKNPYNFTDKQIREIYKSVDKKAFSKNGHTITLTLNKDNLVKITEKVKEIVNKNSKDNKFNQATLDNLIKQAKEAKGDVVITQMKISDETLNRTVNWSNHKVEINSTVNGDGFSVEVNEKNIEVGFRSEKQGDKFKDIFQITSKDNDKKVTQSRIELNSDKVSDNEYKIDGYSRQYNSGIQDIKKVSGYVKTYDKSLELKLEMERADSILVKYSYDTALPKVDSSKQVTKVNDGNINSVMQDIQLSIAEFIKL